MENIVNRGDIFYADLSGTVGSEQSGIRPVIIVQNEIGNQCSSTVIVVPLTKEITTRLNQPTHYLLCPFGNLKYNSVVLAEQIRTIDKCRLKEKIGILKNKVMNEIDKRILIALGINFEK